MTTTRAPRTSPLHAPRVTSAYPRAVAIWLLAVAGLVYAMIVLGGVTRLTQSGLSIVDWDPIMGTVPPFTQSRWEEAFDAYKAFPEYERENSDMTLDEFKAIFYVEYAHRLVGRLIGLALILPTLWFAVRRRIDRRLLMRLLVIFALVGLEGVLGWVMVASGLVDVPRVSPVRLGAHLVLATLIFGAVLWSALDVIDRGTEKAPAPAGARRAGWALLGFVLLTMVSGAFVAGTRAGFAFNTFPLIGGRLVPQGIVERTPVWTNFVDNIATVQFQHRVLALLLFVSVIAFGVFLLRRAVPRRLRSAAWALIALAVLQVGLGISTLVLTVPVALAASHQAVAVALFGVVLSVVHESRPRYAGSVSSAYSGGSRDIRTGGDDRPRVSGERVHG